jgi:hypothetical protein
MASNTNSLGNTAFSQDERSYFERFGYLYVKEAFRPDKALLMQDFIWRQMSELGGIHREDRSTWTSVPGGLNKTARHPIYEAINSPRLIGAVDQLLGAGRWKHPKSWGAFLVSLPEAEAGQWAVTFDWHWDGNPDLHLESLNGLFVFTFFSEVRPQGGGTLIVEGSHHHILDLHRRGEARRRHKSNWTLLKDRYAWFANLSQYSKDLTQDEAERRLMRERTSVGGKELRLIELTGSPGDAVLCHPVLLHARARNCQDAPRFMRVKPIEKLAES